DHLPDQPDWIHLDVRRRDNQQIGVEHFRDLQRIKNELVGPEHDAFERYPPESQLRDASNNYHLWVRKTPGSWAPFGFRTRHVQYASWDTNGQAPLEEGD